MVLHARFGAYLLVAIGLTGCTTTVRQKMESIRPFRALVLRGEPTLTFLAARRVQLQGGGKPMQVGLADGQIFVSHQCEGEILQPDSRDSFRFSIRQPEVCVAQAVPLEEPGYFLTVAHATQRKPLYLYWTDGTRMEWGFAEVVWQDDEADLALLRAQVRGIPTLRWGAPPAVGDRVFTTANGSPSAGSICAVARIQVGAREPRIDAWEIQNDAPVQDGDSGAALIDLNGDLLGVHSSTGFNCFRQRKTRRAVRPDPAGLRALIRAHRSTPPPPQNPHALPDFPPAGQ